MKKNIFALVLCLALLLTSTAFATSDNARVASDQYTATPSYVFDADPESPMMPWPIVRLSYNVTIDHPFEFQRKEIIDPKDPHLGEWTRVEPVELYRWSDESWRSDIPTDTPAAQLVKEPFYLMEKGYYYRVVADFSGRTDNIDAFYSSANYSMYDVYSGLLGAGRTGAISIELNESINLSTERDENAASACIIHRARLRIASVNGVNFTPRAYASNVNGIFIITYFPSESTDRQDYYTETTMDLILKRDSLEMPLYNVLY